MRRLTILAMVLALPVSLGGCGGGGQATTVTTTQAEHAAVTSQETESDHARIERLEANERAREQYNEQARRDREGEANGTFRCPEGGCP